MQAVGEERPNPARARFLLGLFASARAAGRAQNASITLLQRARQQLAALEADVQGDGQRVALAELDAQFKNMEMNRTQLETAYPMHPAVDLARKRGWIV